MRLLLKTVLGILMAGLLCTLLLVGAYLMLAKTPPPLGIAQAVQTRDEAAPPAPTEETGSLPRLNLSSNAEPPPIAPLQQLTTPSATSPHDGGIISYRDVLNPETGEVRRVPVLENPNPPMTTRYYGVRPPATPATRLTPADLRTLQLADKIRRSEDDAERAELREQLVSALGVAFDERRKRQSEAIDDLEKQLDELRALYTQRGERKDEIVQRRVSELLAEPDVLAWDPMPRLGSSGVLRPAEPVPVGPLTAPERSTYSPSAPSVPGDGPFTTPRSLGASAPTFDTMPPTTQPEPPPADAAAREEKTSSPDRTEASPLGDAAQILELLAELRQIEEEIDTGLLKGHEAVAKQRLQFARAKLELAEIRWAHTEDMLQNQVDAAKTQLEPAETRLAEYKILHQKGVTPAFEVLDAEVKFQQAAAEVRAAENLFRAWEEMDAILREHRGANETIAEEPQEDAEAEQPTEQEPKPD